jgi:hypothetical protein
MTRPKALEPLAAVLLEQLRAGMSEVDATRHRLGFIHMCPFHEGDAFLRPFHEGDAFLRLNIWPRDGQAPAEHLGASPIHDHLWDLVSQVLCGHLGNHLVQVLAGSREHCSHRVGSVEYRGRRNTIAASEDYVSWRNSDIQIVHAGERYGVPPALPISLRLANGDQSQPSFRPSFWPSYPLPAPSGLPQRVARSSDVYHRWVGEPG